MRAHEMISCSIASKNARLCLTSSGGFIGAIVPSPQSVSQGKLAHFFKSPQNTTYAGTSVSSSLAEVNGSVAALLGSGPSSKASDPDYVNRLASAEQVLVEFARSGRDIALNIPQPFSLALFDPSKEEALVVADRFGTLPVYYFRHPSGAFCVASTLKDLIDTFVERIRTSPQQLYNYFFFHNVPSPSTIYEDIFKLEPGSCLTYNNRTTTSQTYWHPAFTESSDYSFPDAKARLFEQLYSSIPDSLPETTGCFLSGGLDSSTVTGIASKNSNALPVFSIGFGEPGYDELNYARIAAKAFGADLHERTITPDDVLAAIPTIAQSYDEPFGNSSAVPTFYCAELAKQHGVNTLLAGDGGDEIFAGNARYAKQLIFDYYNRIPPSFRRNLFEPMFSGNSVLSKLPLTRKISRYIEQARQEMPARLESYNHLCHFPPQEIFEKDFLTKVDPANPFDLLERRFSEVADATLLNRMLYLDWKFTLADNDLRKVAAMCDTAGVKVQYPMLAPDLVDFSTTIPSKFKIRHNQLRYFYRSAMKGFLPPEVLNKNKHGFGLPFGEWLKSSAALENVVYSSLRALGQREVVRSEFIEQLISTHRVGHSAFYGSFIWVLMIFEQWMQAHID